MSLTHFRSPPSNTPLQTKKKMVEKKREIGITITIELRDLYKILKEHFNMCDSGYIVESIFKMMEYYPHEKKRFEIIKKNGIQG